ncbi:MAG: hypothetical protein MPN21_27120 [Thermoanaerobaculia bacterium]|nr:hypothetical protein [Thermoanaerobaculia bacterium]
MDARYYIDPDTGQPHIYNHDVGEDEVEDILEHPDDDFQGKKGARIALGQTRDGRCLQVVYSPDPGGQSVFVITAYPLTGKALAAFRRRRRKKKR